MKPESLVLPLFLSAAVACSSAGESSDVAEAAVADGPCVVVSRGGTRVDAAALDDPFARFVFQKATTCASKPADVLKVLASKGPKDVDGVPSQQVFVVSELADQDPNAEYRFVVTQKIAEDDFDLDRLFVSVLGNPQEQELHDRVEVMSFSPSLGAYRFYLEDNGRWTLSGDSNEIVPGKPAPFACAGCHTTGAPVMKELALPWNNWHSDSAQMADVPGATAAFTALFARRGDAYELEQQIRAGTARFTTAHVEKVLGGKVSGQSLKSVLRRAMCDVGEPNLESRELAHKKRFRPISPGTDTVFLFNPNGFSNNVALIDPMFQGGVPELELDIPLERPSEGISFPMTAYVKAITDAGQKVGGIAGDTMFPLFRPARSQSDLVAVASLANTGRITQDLLLDLLMTDFTNPVFSKERCELAATAPDSAENAEALRTAWIRNLEGSALPGADGLKKRLATPDDGSAHAATLSAFLRACVHESATAPDAFAASIVKLASQQRNTFRVKFGSIVESPALLPEDALTDTAPDTWRLSPTTCKLERQ